MRKLRILIIENDDDEQFFIRKGFNAADLFDITAMLFNGDELINILDEQIQQLPDLILSDLNMPGKNGYEILEELSNHPKYSSIPVVIASNDAGAIISERCKRLGAFAMKAKPANFNLYNAFAKSLYAEVIDKIA